MNIYIIPYAYPNASNPVANVFIYEQAKALQALGHNIVVLNVITLPSAKLFAKRNRKIEEHDDGFSVRYTIPIKSFAVKRFPKINAYIFKKNMKKLYQYALSKENPPDLLYAHFSCFAGYAASSLAEMTGTKLVTEEHYGYFLQDKINKTMREILKKTVDASDSFICVSEGLKAAVIRHTNTDKPIHVVPNMVDDCFKYYPKQESEKFVFSSIGNLYKGKRFALLINAFCKAFSSEENVCLRIGGSGEELDNLRSIIVSEKREHQISLLGRLDREQALEEYIHCDCFALASEHETFGIVYREAMAVGRPVITTNHGGFTQDNWDDALGKMVEVDDLDGLAEALKYMYAHINEFDGEKISDFCLKKHSSAIVIAKINDILCGSC